VDVDRAVASFCIFGLVGNRAALRCKALHPARGFRKTPHIHIGFVLHFRRELVRSVEKRCIALRAI
jgi:hypothetical protein